RIGDLRQMTVIVLKETDGHPFPCDNKVGLSVVVEIHPPGGGDHSRAADHWTNRSRDVGEMSLIVMEDKAAGRKRISLRDPAADENIRLAVAVEIADADTTCNGADAGRDCISSEGKMPFTVIEIEARDVVAGILRVQPVAAGDQQIQITVAVGVE